MRTLLAALACCFALTAAVHAGEAEVKAAQDVIDGQLKAFQAGDKDLAYSFAAPSIKNAFRTPEIFMNMVANGYRPVAQPRSYSFGQAEEDGASVAQRVMITGPDGKDYEALYRLEKQPDGSFKINAVSLRAASTLTM